MKTEIDLGEVKKIQIDMLKYIADICKKNNIQFFLFAGTMLGAVRHNGYIPWDDDIDIAVKREDYELLLSLLDESDIYNVLSWDNTEGYFYLFAKLVNSKTCLVEKGVKPIEKMGIYIDIFPLDNLPENEQMACKYLNKAFNYRALLYYSVFTKEQFKNASLRRKFCCLMSKLIGTKKIIRYADDYCKRTNYHFSGKIIDLVAVPKKKTFVNKNVFEKSILCRFEDGEYPIPEDYDQYLSALYGKYMELPPEKDRVLKHDFKAYWR